MEEASPAGPLRAGPQASGDLNISGDSWAAKPTSSIPYCMKTPPPLKPRKPMPMDRNFTCPMAWPIRPSNGWTIGKACGMYHSLCTTHRGRFMHPSRCPRSGAINIKDSSMTDGMCTGNNCWNVRKNWDWFPKMQKWSTGRR
jgi:hypothetical protein